MYRVCQRERIADLAFPKVPPNDNLAFRTGEFSLFVILGMGTPEQDCHRDLERHTTTFQSGTRLRHMVNCTSAAYLHNSQMSHIAQRPCAQRVAPHASHAHIGVVLPTMDGHTRHEEVFAQVVVGLEFSE
jgi:hypothetical protein